MTTMTESPDRIRQMDLLPALQQIRILYAQSLTTFLFPVLAAACLGFFLWDVARREILALWLGVIFLHALLRCCLLWRYFCTGTDRETGTWLNLFTVSAFTSGIIWGLAGIILIPYDTTDPAAFTLHNGLVLLTTCGLVSGAMISYAVSIRVLVCYSLPALVVPAFYLISLGDRYNTSFGGLILLYYLFILVAGVRINRQLVYFMEMESSLVRLQQQYDKLKAVYTAYREHTGGRHRRPVTRSLRT